MERKESNSLRTTAILFVLLMAGLQLAYAIFAFADPAGFSLIRGTELFSAGDTDWVRIYASRTLFIALIIGYLLYRRQFTILAAASPLGTVMPATDAWLAYQASAGGTVIFKHVATASFLIITFAILRSVAKHGEGV